MAEPKIRFKRDDGSIYPEWCDMPLNALVTENLDPVPTPKGGYRRVGIYCHAKGTFQEDVPADKILDVDTMYRIHKDNLIVNITFAWEHAVAIVKPEDEGLLVSHRFPEYSFNDGQVPGFYKYLILRPYFKNKLSLASPGGAGRNRVLNKAQFKEIIITVPCEEEQQKIADFLCFVDEVISASEQEVANLETQKKAVMKKIFSQEVRFKREDGTGFPKWEESSVVPYCTVFCDGDWIESRDQSEYGIRLVQTGNVGNGVFLAKETRKRFISNETFDRLHCSEVFPGDILISRLPDPAGRACIVPNSSERMITAVDCSIVRTDESRLLPGYLVQFYQSATHFKYVDSMLAGGTRQRVSRGNLEEENILIPCLEEQRLIADFLSNFDEAIAAAKKELELWKELKKGLLQQMFV